eukprot:1937038-Prymnesium_polylepis.1
MSVVEQLILRVAQRIVGLVLLEAAKSVRAGARGHRAEQPKCVATIALSIRTDGELAGCEESRTAEDDRYVAEVAGNHWAQGAWQALLQHYFVAGKLIDSLPAATLMKSHTRRVQPGIPARLG